MLEVEAEGKDKKENTKDKWKEKELSKCNSWADLRKSGLILEDISHIKRHDNSERSSRNRYGNIFVIYVFDE